MKLRFCTSIATGLGSYLQGQVIDVLRVPPEFRSWLESGVIEIVRDDAPEVADLVPLGETAMLPRGRSSKRPGRARRSFVSRPVPA